MSAYGIRVYADTLGCWHAHITFPDGAGRDPAGTRLIRIATESAKRTIRAEVVAHMAPEPVARLAYKLSAFTSSPDTRRLSSLTLSEDWHRADTPPTERLPKPASNGDGAFR